jgi:hypothetical protein
VSAKTKLTAPIGCTKMVTIRMGSKERRRARKVAPVAAKLK